LESIKSGCREEQRLAFDAFEGKHKWESLEKIRTRASHQLRNAGDVGPCLDRYFNLDLELGEIERCYDDAASAIEAAAEFQYELEAGK
jgi:hypothetical protein